MFFGDSLFIDKAIDLFFGLKIFFCYQILKKMSSGVAISFGDAGVAQVSRNGLFASHNGCSIIYVSE